MSTLRYYPPSSSSILWETPVNFLGGTSMRSPGDRELFDVHDAAINIVAIATTMMRGKRSRVGLASANLFGITGALIIAVVCRPVFAVVVAA